MGSGRRVLMGWMALVMGGALACAVAPGSAGAQTILSPPGEAVAYGANPSRTGESSETSVFGPLRTSWSRKLPAPALTPLIVDGVALVATGFDGTPASAGMLFAYRIRDGRLLWRQRTSDDGAAPVAVDDGVVTSIDRAGNVRAFAVGSGKLLWQRQVPSHSLVTRAVPPVADAGVVYVIGHPSDHEGSRAYAFRLSDGAPVWPNDGLLTPRPELSEDTVAPSLSRGSLFAGGIDPGVWSVSRANGSLRWQSDSGSFGGGFETMVSGGVVVSADGGVYDATSGSVRNSLPLFPFAAAGSTAYGLDGDGRIAAASLSTGASAWTTKIGVDGLRRSALLVGPTLFVRDGEQLHAVGRATGQRLPSQRLQLSPTDAEPRQGMAAGSGRLLISADDRVAALEPVLKPKAGGVALAVSAFDVFAGARVRFVAGIGRDLVTAGPRPALWEADPAPFGGFQTVSETETMEDGTSYLRRGVGSNTRMRFRLPGGSSAVAVIRAYPKYEIRIRPVGPKNGVIATTVKLIPPANIAGMRTFAYFGDRSRKMFTRLGSARLRPAAKEATAKIRFRLLDPRKVDRRDIVAVCVRGLGKRWGRNVGLQKQCGKRRAPYRPTKAGSLRAPRLGAPDHELGATPAARPALKP